VQLVGGGKDEAGVEDAAFDVVDDDALDAGTYFLEALVYSGTERDTYPVEPKEMRIMVKAHGTNAVS
jgi:hypothetical protein